MNKYLYLAGGYSLYVYDINTGVLEKLFSDNQSEVLMGLCMFDGFLYVGAKTKIYKFKIHSYNNLSKVKVFNAPGPYPAFHQLVYNGGFIYITCTNTNEIWKLTIDLELKKRFVIPPPLKDKPIGYKTNYNHLNNLFFDGDIAYVCLNWLTTTQFGPSGVSVVESDTFKEIDRFKYGWEAHNFCKINRDSYVLCGSSGSIKKVHHAHKAGLMVNGGLVFEHNPSKFFCKDFSMDDDRIYLVGGEVCDRRFRPMANGKLYILNKNFEILVSKYFNKSGGFCGCLTDSIDLTKNMGV